MSELAGNMQTHFKKTSSSLALFSMKFISGAIVGLTFALIMQEVLGKADDDGLMTFLLVIVITTGIFMRVAKSWGLTAILIFDLIAVLVGLVLRLYIMVAPGA